MEIGILIFTLLVGVLAGVFGFKAAGGNDNSGNLRRIRKELDGQRGLIESERTGINRERERVAAEGIRLGEERGIVERDKQLIAELRKRAEEATGG